MEATLPDGRHFLLTQLHGKLSFLTLISILVLAGLSVIAPKGIIFPFFFTVFIVFWYQIRIQNLKFSFTPFPTLVLCFCVWSFLLCLWSEEPLKSFLDSLKITSITIGGLSLFSLSSKDRWIFQPALEKGLLYGIPFCAATLTGIVLIWPILSHKLSRAPEFLISFNRGCIIMALLIWPFLAVCIKQRYVKTAIFTTMGVIIGVFYLESEAAKLSIVIGLLMFLGGKFLRPASFKGLGIIIAFLTFSSPWIAKTIFSPEVVMEHTPSLFKIPSHRHRLYIFEACVNKIFENPFLGRGLNYSRYVHENTPNTEEITLNSLNLTHDQPLKLKRDLAGVARHPHNASLQVWYEMGLPGIILFAVFLSSLLWKMGDASLSRLDRQTSLATFTVGLVVAHISFNLWQTWWFSFLWFAGFIVWVVQEKKETE